MRLSQLKEFEQKLEDTKNIFGEDSKAYKNALSDYEATKSVWDNTPEDVRIIDWQEKVEETPPKLMPELEDNRAYLFAEGELKPLDQVLIPTANKGLVPIFVYPDDDTRYMENTFKSGEE